MTQHKTEDVARLEAVQFAYPRKAPLFTDLNYRIRRGGVVGLLGKNGAGKTTMLKLICGVLFARGGSVSLFGDPAERRRAATLARISYIPEQFEVPAIRLREYMMVHAGYFPRFDGTMMDRFLQRFEVAGNPGMRELSFGQQKKVLIALALSTGAELVVLDEPTNGLDIPSKQVFRRMVAEAAGDDRTVIISTHQVKDVENLIDPIVVLDNGRIVFDATMEQITGNVAMQRFPSEVDAERAGAFAMESYLGSTVALVPLGGTGMDNRSTVAGEEVPGSLDLELLFHAAVSRGAALQAACGGAR